MFMLNQGVLEQFSRGLGAEKFRKTKYKSIEDAIEKINIFISTGGSTVKAIISTIDEEFEKARTSGAKDKQPRKRKFTDDQLAERRAAKFMRKQGVKAMVPLKDPGKDYGDIDERPVRGAGKPFKFKWEKSRTVGALDKKKRFRKKFAKQNREEIQTRNAKFDKEYWEAVRDRKPEERSPLWKKWHRQLWDRGLAD